MYEPPRHYKSLKLSISLPVRANLLCTLQCETPCKSHCERYPDKAVYNYTCFRNDNASHVVLNEVFVMSVLLYLFLNL